MSEGCVVPAIRLHAEKDEGQRWKATRLGKCSAIPSRPVRRKTKEERLEHGKSHQARDSL